MAERWASGRRLYPDNLKVVLIAGVIAIHGVLSYAGMLDVWWYTEVREVTLSVVTQGLLFMVVGPFGVLLIPLLFLVAGLLTAPSVDRKGPGPYAKDRLLRLGVPFIVYVALLQPVVVYSLERPLGVADRSFFHELLGSPPQVDLGPLWFVGVLLVYSLVYAGWVAVRRPAARGRAAAHPIRVTHLLLAAAVVAPTTFLIRLVYPVGGESLIGGFNFWEWPACITAFVVGIVGYRQGWLEAVPGTLARQCRNLTLLTAALFAAAMLGAMLVGALDEFVWRGGPNWVALMFVCFESVLTLLGPVWLLSVAQRRLDRRLRWVSPAVRRSAFGAFVVQVLVLTVLAVVMRPLPLPAEVKALVVAGGGVAGSFALAWLLISRVPGVRRFL
ncbi:MAG TPA: acyltransferase family protein [Nocardioidaceae bacterium]|nr:acyltransferase family protein [Nocardioidaceae bacterium]